MNQWINESIFSLLSFFKSTVSTQLWTEQYTVDPLGIYRAINQWINESIFSLLSFFKSTVSTQLWTEQYTVDPRDIHKASKQPTNQLMSQSMNRTYLAWWRYRRLYHPRSGSRWTGTASRSSLAWSGARSYHGGRGRTWDTRRYQAGPGEGEVRMGVF